jgi:hypothetical protein
MERFLVDGVITEVRWRTVDFTKDPEVPESLFDCGVRVYEYCKDDSRLIEMSENIPMDCHEIEKWIIDSIEAVQCEEYVNLRKQMFSALIELGGDNVKHFKKTLKYLNSIS